MINLISECIAAFFASAFTNCIFRIATYVDRRYDDGEIFRAAKSPFVLSNICNKYLSAIAKYLRQVWNSWKLSSASLSVLTTLRFSTRVFMYLELRHVSFLKRAFSNSSIPSTEISRRPQSRSSLLVIQFSLFYSGNNDLRGNVQLTICSGHRVSQ